MSETRFGTSYAEYARVVVLEARSRFNEEGMYEQGFNGELGGSIEHVLRDLTCAGIDGQSVYQAPPQYGLHPGAGGAGRGRLFRAGVPDWCAPALGYARKRHSRRRRHRRNRYVGRTFIEPTCQASASWAPSEAGTAASGHEGQRLVVIDDSIVQARNTSKKLVQMLATRARRRCTWCIEPRGGWLLTASTPTRATSSLPRTCTLGRERVDRPGFAGVHLPRVTPGARRALEFCDACFTGDLPVDRRRGQEELSDEKDFEDVYAEGNQ